jgi:hypothetical protein
MPTALSASSGDACAGTETASVKALARIRREAGVTLMPVMQLVPGDRSVPGRPWRRRSTAGTAGQDRSGHCRRRAAAFSRAWVVRQLQLTLVVHAATSTTSTQPPSPPAPAELRRLRASVGIEAVVVLAVLAVTSMLVATEPAKTAYHPTVAATSRSAPTPCRCPRCPQATDAWRSISTCSTRTPSPPIPRR